MSTELEGAQGIALLDSVVTFIYRGTVTRALSVDLPPDALVAARGTLGGALSVVEALPEELRAALVKLARGFENMMAFAGLCHRAGVRIVVGSHSTVPKAGRGWAYQRELELLAECGLTPMETIAAATRRNAEFFRLSARLGTIQSGKLADLVLLEGDPLKDIRAMRRVERVMLNGRWIVPQNR